MLKSIAFGFLLLLSGFKPIFAQSGEQFILEPFMGALGGGPSGGPIASSGAVGYRICEDKQGNRYFAGDGKLLKVDTLGKIRSIGSTTYGFNDGPAPEAAYKLGDGGYYSTWTLSCNANGDLFLADGGNKRIRRVYRTDSCWMTETWAGGGTGTLNTIGENAPAKSIDIGGGIVAQCNSRGEVVIWTYYQKKIYRVSSDGTTITLIALSPVPDPETYTTVDATADTMGNVYFLNRCPQTVVEVTADDRAFAICGKHATTTSTQRDTLPHYRYAWMVSQLVAAANGECVYINGGDSYFITRVPTDSTQWTSTLGYNGRFYLSPGTPGNNGPTYIDTAKTDIKTFQVCSLSGGDRTGGIYIGLFPWVAYSHGGLPTQICRLKRIR